MFTIKELTLIKELITGKLVFCYFDDILSCSKCEILKEQGKCDKRDLIIKLEILLIPPFSPEVKKQLKAALRRNVFTDIWQFIKKWLRGIK